MQPEGPRTHRRLSCCSRSERVAGIKLGIIKRSRGCRIGGSHGFGRRPGQGDYLSQKHPKAPVDRRWKALLFVNATPRLHIVKPAKGVQSPRSPIHCHSRLSRVLKLTPSFPSLPSDFHKRPVVDDPPAARCALLFALSNCSSTPSLSPQSAFSRSSLPLHTSKRAPISGTWSLGRSFCTSILLHQPSNPPGCDRPFSVKNILDSICLHWY